MCRRLARISHLLAPFSVKRIDENVTKVIKNKSVSRHVNDSRQVEDVRLIKRQIDVNYNLH